MSTTVTKHHDEISYSIETYAMRVPPENVSAENHKNSPYPYINPSVHAQAKSFTNGNKARPAVITALLAPHKEHTRVVLQGGPRSWWDRYTEILNPSVYLKDLEKVACKIRDNSHLAIATTINEVFNSGSITFATYRHQLRNYVVIEPNPHRVEDGIIGWKTPKRGRNLMIGDAIILMPTNEFISLIAHARQAVDASEIIKISV